MRPGDNLDHTLPLGEGCSALKSLWVKQVRKHTVQPDIPGAQPWSRAPRRASRGHVDHLPMEEAWLWVCPGCRARLKAGCVCRGRRSQPCSRTEHSLCPQLGPVYTAAGSPILMPNQTPQSDADPSLLSLKPVGTSGKLDLTSAGAALPFPWPAQPPPSSGPVAFSSCWGWLPPTLACLDTQAEAAHHLWPE